MCYFWNFFFVNFFLFSHSHSHHSTTTILDRVVVVSPCWSPSTIVFIHILSVFLLDTFCLTGSNTFNNFPLLLSALSYLIIMTMSRTRTWFSLFITFVLNSFEHFIVVYFMCELRFPTFSSASSTFKYKNNNKKKLFSFLLSST